MLRTQKLLLFLAVAASIIILTTLITQKRELRERTLPRVPEQESFKNATPYNKEIKVGGTRILVELADTPQKRNLGLSGRNSLGDNEGMLFVFDKENIRPAFWMKDMNFAIDIVWIDNGNVVKVDEKIPPPEPGTSENQLRFYTPIQPIDYVLEVNAGFAEENNIKVSDSVDLSEVFND